jgi:tetratricopeptide (TPR) repeat protein
VAVGDFKACYDLAQWSLRFPELREQTKEALRDCIKIDPQFVDAYILLTDLLQEESRRLEEPSEQRLSELISLYKHAVRSGVEDPRIYYELGVATRKVKLLGAALPCFRRAIEISKIANSPEIAKWSHQEAGEILLELGRTEEALQDFDAVLATSPDDFRSLLGRGEAKISLGELDEAGVSLTQAVASDPYYPKPFLLLGSVAYYKGELSEAEVLLGRARAVGLPNPAVLTTLGLVHSRMGKFSSAGSELAEALSVDPQYWQAEIVRGYLAENEGRTEDAISAYGRALDIEPSAGIAHFKLAGAYYASGEMELAVSELNLALENNYRPAEIFKFLGRIEYERENYDIASRFLRYAIAADDKDPDAHYMLGMSCLKLGLNALAERHFESSVDVNPAHFEALDGLGYLAYSSNNFKVATARFTSSLSANPNDNYASDALSKINKVLNWDRWEDNFKRPDSDDVSNGWTEENDARYGIEMKIDSNGMKFTGTQREADKRMFLYRTETGSAFARIEAVMNGLQAAGARFGVRIEKRDSKGEMQGAIILMRDTDGSLAYNYTESKGKWVSTDMPVAIEQIPLDTKSHAFGISVVDARTGTFDLILDGVQKVRITCGPLTRAKELVVGIYGSADAGVPWTLVVERVRIYRFRAKDE